MYNRHDHRHHFHSLVVKTAESRADLEEGREEEAAKPTPQSQGTCSGLQLS